MTAGTLISATKTAQLRSYQTFLSNQSNPVTRSPKAYSKICWISERWYDHEGQSNRKAPWYREVLELLPPGWGHRFQQTHTKPAFSCPFVWAASIALAYDSIATVNRWDLIYSLLKKAITCQSVLVFPSHGSFFQASYKALERKDYIKSYKWHLKKSKSWGLPELYCHFYCYWILKYILNRIHKSKKVNKYWWMMKEVYKDGSGATSWFRALRKQTQVTDSI